MTGDENGATVREVTVLEKYDHTADPPTLVERRRTVRVNRAVVEVAVEEFAPGEGPARPTE